MTVYSKWGSVSQCRQFCPRCWGSTTKEALTRSFPVSLALPKWPADTRRWSSTVRFGCMLGNPVIDCRVLNQPIQYESNFRFCFYPDYPYIGSFPCWELGSFLEVVLGGYELVRDFTLNFCATRFSKSEPKARGLLVKSQLGNLPRVRVREWGWS